METDTADRDRARALVLEHGWNPTAYQILNPGMRLWFPHAGDAAVGYVVAAKTWVIAGAPVCPIERLRDVAAELRHDAARAGAWELYFGAGERLEQLLGSRDYHLLRLGAQPTWNAQSWSRIVKGKSSLRAQINRARNKGLHARELSRTEIERRLAELREILNAWLGTRGLPPLHFMTEADILGDLRDRRVFVAERGASASAFLLATPVPARRGWLVEEWPRRPDSPNGTTHLLVDCAMRTFAAEGARFVTLGLAPLSDRAGVIGDGEPMWLRALLRWLRAHGRRFYNFRGLDAFKASLEPERWEPVYAIVRGQRVTLRSLRAVAVAFGGGSPVKLVARALLNAAWRETRRLAAWTREAR